MVITADEHFGRQSLPGIHQRGIQLTLQTMADGLLIEPNYHEANPTQN